MVEVFQIITYVVLIISILLTSVATIIHVLCARKRDKAYYKMLEETEKEFIKSINERVEEE